MDCPNCGAYNASQSVRCRRCNHLLDPGAEETGTSSFDDQQDAQAGDDPWRSEETRDTSWDSGRTGEPVEDSDPWSYSEPAAPEPQESWSTGQSSTTYGTSSTTRPEYGPGFGPPPDIPNYLWQSIVVTLCCCWPIGIPAIVFASRVNAFVASGNYAGAEEASQKAKNWVIAAVVVGLLFYLAFFCITVVAGD